MELHYGFPNQRATRDIDFGIRVNTWDEFAAMKSFLIRELEYAQYPRFPHRLRSCSGEIIDLVPFGGIEENHERRIRWPSAPEMEMNAFGFEEAYQQALYVSFADNLNIKVTSLAGLALMKLAAWRDRRLIKDAVDFLMIVRFYLDTDNLNRLYSESD